MPRTVTNARQRHFHSQRRVGFLRQYRHRVRYHPLHDTFASSTSSFSVSLCPLPSRARRARNVTSISSSGPTPRLWQPSRGASGDCETGHCSRRSGTLASRCDATPDSRFRLIRDNFLRSRINPRSVQSAQSRRTKVFQRLP